MLKKSLLLLFTISIFLTGCWNRREPKTMAIVDSALADINEDNTYSITFEILAPSQAGKEISVKTTTEIIKKNADSLPEALRLSTVTINRKLYVGHVRARFFTEKIASKDIVDIMDYYFRNHEARQDPYVIVIKGDNPDLLYSSDIGISESFGAYVETLSHAQKPATGQSVFISTLDFLKDIYIEGKNPVAGVVEIIEDTSPEKSSENSSGSSEKSSEKKYKLEFNGLAAFKDNKLVGFLDGIETRSYNIITGNFESAFISIAMDESAGNDLILEIINSKPEIKSSFNNNQIIFDVKIKMNAVIASVKSDIDVSKIEVIKKVEETFNKLIEDQINNTIKKTQTEFKSDIFGFGCNMHRQQPDEWKKYKEDWHNIFPEAKINVKVDSAVRLTGELITSFKTED